MADRIKLRRGPKNKMDLNVYELGYATDSDEERLYFNNGSMVPIPNEKDITDIKAELTEATNVSNKNKQDVSELKESVAGIIKTGVAKLVQYSYDIELSEKTQKVDIPYEKYSSVTDTLKIYVNGLAIQNDQYTITDPVENDGIITNGYIVLKIERPAGTIVRMEVWKNVPSGEEGEVNGNIIAKNSLPLDRIIGIDDKVNKSSIVNNCSTTEDGFILDARQGKFLNDKLTSFNVVKPSLLITSNTKTNTTPITLANYTIPFNCNALIIGNACINVVTIDEFSIKLNKNDSTFGYSLNKLDTGKKEISTHGIASLTKGDIVSLTISSTVVETGLVYPDGALTSLNILLLPR